MKNLKIGDVVKLKSGGPKMTVSGEDEYNNICCDWFSDKSIQHGYFVEAQLILIDDAE